MVLPDLSPRPGDLDRIKTASRDELAALQLTRLRESMWGAYQRSRTRAESWTNDDRSRSGAPRGGARGGDPDEGGPCWRCTPDAELSPELVRMIALKPGGLRRGQGYLGIGRRGYVVWSTRSTVTDAEPPAARLEHRLERRPAAPGNGARGRCNARRPPSARTAPVSLLV